MNKNNAFFIIIGLVIIQLILTILIFLQDFIRGQQTAAILVAIVLILLAIILIIYDKSYGIGKNAYIEKTE